MTRRWLESSKRAGWFAGAAAGASAVAATFFVNFSPDAQSAVSPVFGTNSFADIVASVSPAVVNISVSKVEHATPTGFRGSQRGGQRQQQQPFDEFFQRFFEMPGQPGFPGQPSQPQERRSEGQGSGFIIEADGFIVTNNHVIDGADKILVTMQDGRELDATLVGRDTKTDLALLKVESADLPHVQFGNSDGARVGDWVLAIGNPFGLGGTATAGIISARGRDIQSGPYDDYLQIDASINLGNSGGPVFDVAGQVVGVNTAIFSPNGGNIGIGFAIPANQAKSVIAELKDTGSVERGWLGVQIQSMDKELAETLGLEDEHGALIADVLGDGPAAKGGLRQGDVITKFNDHAIDSAKTLSRVVADSDPSDTANVTVWREGKSHDLRVKLGEAERGEPVAAAEQPHEASGSTALGLTLQPLTAEQAEQLSLPADIEGALVVAVDPKSAAAEKGIRPGDLITKVNQQQIDSVDDAVTALNQAHKQESPALLVVRRGDSQRFVALSFS